MPSLNSFSARDSLTVGGQTFEIFAISAVQGSARLPFTHKVLLENLLRTEDGANVTADQIRALAGVNRLIIYPPGTDRVQTHGETTC